MRLVPNTEQCCILLDEFGFLVSLTKTFLDDLALLTLPTSLESGAKRNKGARGIVIVFDVIKAIVDQHITTATPRVIEMKNAAGRTVLIEFAPDPDIIIRERLSEKHGDFRNIIATKSKEALISPTSTTELVRLKKPSESEIQRIC
ncbi:MAG: XcyI family restriction endonuclease [Thermodesulfovibrionales bacterium]